MSIQSGTNLDKLLNLITKDPEGVSSKDIISAIGLTQPNQLYGMINVLRRKHRIPIIIENGKYKVSDKEEDIIPEEVTTPHQEKTSSPVSNKKIFDLMTEEDKGQYLEMKRKSIFYAKASESLIESYKQTQHI